MKKPHKRPAIFVGTALKDLRALPEEVQDLFGRAILRAQWGGKSENAKPLKGYKGAGVLEIVEDFATDTYRAIYTVRFTDTVYVLHVFQKKSTQGIRTASRDLELIEARLRTAEAHYAQAIQER